LAIETEPLWGPVPRQSIGPVFHARSLYLGDQWQIGDWNGYQEALRKLPFHSKFYPQQPESPQNLKECDPQWGRACGEGTFLGEARTMSYLSQAKVPVHLSKHARFGRPGDSCVPRRAFRSAGIQSRRTDQSCRRALYLQELPQGGRCRARHRTCSVREHTEGLAREYRALTRRCRGMRAPAVASASMPMRLSARRLSP
jgi:hypothetical protein